MVWAYGIMGYADYSDYFTEEEIASNEASVIDVEFMGDSEDTNY